MDDDLRNQVETLLTAAPCSVEMPAGTGKTYLLAAAAVVAAEGNQRSLILTHTNAGVDAIRNRLKAFGIQSGLVRVDTITSWAFALAGSYSDIAQVSVPEIPDWSRSDDYICGAIRAAHSEAIRNVHAISFGYLFVDEYQDCTLLQHDFVLAVAAAVPKTVVFGDELQAIFGFAGALVTWPGQVIPSFPAHAIAIHPHRWTGHNHALGAWLLEIRPQLVHGGSFDVAAHNVPGLEFVTNSGQATVSKVGRSFRDSKESVVLLDKWPNDVAGHASRLGGAFSVMEDIGGKFMVTQLATLPPEGDYQLAAWFAKFAKACVIGLSGLDSTILRRLESNQGITHYSRQGLFDVLVALDAIRANPTYEQLGKAAPVIQRTNGLRVYRWEAWNDTHDAIAQTADNGELAIDNLARIRDRLRQGGRRSSMRIASRTLLVKGLEYDHVIIANLAKFADPRNLYVALSRARNSVTIIGGTSRLTLENENHS